ncbi:MAG: hypothetical protein ABIH23_08545 [bacterium]
MPEAKDDKTQPIETALDTGDVAVKNFPPVVPVIEEPKPEDVAAQAKPEEDVITVPYRTGPKTYKRSEFVEKHLRAADKLDELQAERERLRAELEEERTRMRRGVGRSEPDASGDLESIARAYENAYGMDEQQAREAARTRLKEQQAAREATERTERLEQEIENIKLQFQLERAIAPFKAQDPEFDLMNPEVIEIAQATRANLPGVFEIWKARRNAKESSGLGTREKTSASVTGTSGGGARRESRVLAAEADSFAKQYLNNPTEKAVFNQLIGGKK